MYRNILNPTFTSTVVRITQCNTPLQSSTSFKEDRNYDCEKQEKGGKQMFTRNYLMHPSDHERQGVFSYYKICWSQQKYYGGKNTTSTAHNSEHG